MEPSSRSQSPKVVVEISFGEKPLGQMPAQRLLVAILRRAIWDFVLYRNENPEAFDVRKAKTDKGRKILELQHKKAVERQAIAVDAAEWLFWDGEEETDFEGRYSFRYICRLLDIPPQRIRERVLEMTVEDIQKLNNSIKEG